MKDWNPSFNDEWFASATKEEVKELYADNPILNLALEHWKKINPVTHRKKQDPTEEKKD